MDEVGFMGLDTISLVPIVLKSGILEEKKERTVQHDSVLTGQMYLRELLNTENVARFKNVTRMDNSTFHLLLNLLETHGGLVDSKHLSAREKLLMFILVLVGNSNRHVCERLQHSGSTTSLVVHEVAVIMMRCQNRFFYPPKLNDPVPLRISSSHKFTPYFDNCIGAVDGTHIPAVIPVDEQKPFRNRKKFLSQNVLAVANFDQTFSYVLVGCEGSAHDSRVLRDAKTKGLPLLPLQIQFRRCRIRSIVASAHTFQGSEISFEGVQSIESEATER